MPRPPATKIDSEADVLAVDDHVRVPCSEIEMSFVRSSGPGGQRVNKVATKAVLRWDVRGSAGLPDDVRERFIERYGRRISSDGELVLTSDRFRSQARNADDCMDKLRAMLAEVAEPVADRVPTRPSARVTRRRAADKRRLSGKKQLRRKVETDEQDR
jgi:ribosome-associated protein